MLWLVGEAVIVGVEKVWEWFLKPEGCPVCSGLDRLAVRCPSCGQPPFSRFGVDPAPTPSERSRL